jgi:chromosome partitioning protein
MGCVTIAVTNNKGGVGKTTLSLNLAVALAALGIKVGLIDMDPQGHVSVSLDVVDAEGRPLEGVFDLLVNERPLDQILYQIPEDEYSQVRRIPGGALWVLPSGAKTQLAAMNLQLQGGQVDIFTHAIKPLRERCQIIFIDTAPANSLFMTGIYHASDWVLIPSQLSRLSINGVEQTVRQMASLKALHQARVLGIVPTMVQLHTLEDQERLKELVQLFGDLVWKDEALSLSSVWRTSSEEARSIFSFRSTTNPEGKSRAENQMWSMAIKVLERVGVVVG